MDFDDEAADRIFGSNSDNKLAMFVFANDDEEGRKAK